MWNENNYTLRFTANPFYRHEQIILSAGNYDGFLPMSFLREADGLTVRYAPSGFLPLSGYRIERTQDALYLMEKTLLILHAAPEYMLAPERLFLRTDTVFYNKDRDDLRIAFVPRPEDEGNAASSTGTSGSSGTSGTSEASGNTLSRSDAASPSPFQKELILFLAQLKQDLCDSCTNYLLRFARELYYNNPDTSDMLRSIGLLRRQLDAA